MEFTKADNFVGMLFGKTLTYMRRCLFRVLSAGPLPDHIGLILDGNRRYARKWNLGEGMGHRAGFLSLMALMKYCYELGIKYITIYAFSIDNFRRKPEEVESLMDLMLEKIEGMLKEESIVNQFGVRVYFIGNLKLLDDSIRIAAEKAMKATEKNNKTYLLICVAYTSTDEIVHATEESCLDLWNEMQAHKANGAQICDGMLSNGEQEKTDEEKQEKISKQKQDTFGNGKQEKADKEKQEKMSKENREVMRKKEEKEKSNDKQEALGKAISKEEEEEKSNEKQEAFIEEKLQLHRRIKLADIEKHMYMAVAPEVDVLVRTSGEYRLSNFLLWQTWNGWLYCTKALWPEMGLPHLVWAILNFQITHPFFEKRKKQF